MSLNTNCGCCQTKLNTKNVIKVGRNKLGRFEMLLANCKKCNSTIVISYKKILD